MPIVVTGGDGFLGLNLRARLRDMDRTDVVNVTRATTSQELEAALAQADIVYHLAGVNRPRDVAEYDGNATFTTALCDMLRASGRTVRLVYASSTQATRDNPYGRSKRGAELAVEAFGASTGSPVFVLRLTNVFGKWSRPNHNSVVATFCHCLARNLPITIHDPGAVVELIHVDDVIDRLLGLLPPAAVSPGFVETGPVYRATVGEIATLLRAFAESRNSLTIPPVGTGFTRALYSTYVSFLPPEKFAYSLRRHSDSRGTFAEMLRTTDSGQFSFFSAPPGVTRGEHYHHTKTEKFLVVHGSARFDFRHIMTGQTFEIFVDGTTSRMVETVPGWAHSITNIGTDDVLVLLWANEVFDPARPDTIAVKVP